MRSLGGPSRTVLTLLKIGQACSVSLSYCHRVVHIIRSQKQCLQSALFHAHNVDVVVIVSYEMLMCGGNKLN